MASNVSSALGTQRQFSTLPKDTYGQRLNSLPAHVGVAAPTSNDGLLLARSLGVLGESLANFGIAQEKDKEKVGVAKAEQLIRGLSEEDLKKYKAIDLLNTHGQFELADNPYAVMTIEKWRGKYFGAKAQAEYESEVVAKEGRAKTSEEEAARYDKFVRERYPQYAQTTSHADAFNEGFYDNHIPNMLQQVKAQIAEYSKDLRAVRDGTIQAEFGQLAQSSLTLSVDELKVKAQELFRGAGVTKLTREERMILAKNLLNAVAQFSYSPDKVKALADIEIFTGDDGKPVLLGSKVDNSEAIQNAIISARRMNDKAVFEKRLELLKLKPEEIGPYMEELKKTDTEMWRILSPDVDNIYQQAVHAEKVEQAKRAKQAAQQAAMTNMDLVFEAQWNAHMRNSATDGRYPVAQSISDLPDVTYIDESGNTAKAKWTPEYIHQKVSQKMMELYANPNLSPQDKAKTAMRMLSFGPGAVYVKALKGQIQGAFDTANTNTMTQSMDVGSVRSALEMYEADSGTFGRLFGPELTANVQTVRVLRDLGKSTDDALDIFVRGRDALKDPNLREQYTTNYKNQLSGEPNVDLTDMSGETVSLPIGEDSLMNSHIRTMAMYLQGAEYPVGTAIQMAKEKAKENYWAYNGHAFPKAWFSGLDVEDKATTARDFMDNERQALADGAGIFDKEHIFASYNPYTDRVELKGNGVSASYDRATFTRQANQFAYDRVQQALNTPVFKGDYKLEAAPEGMRDANWFDKIKSKIFD